MHFFNKTLPNMKMTIPLLILFFLAISSAVGSTAGISARREKAEYISDSQLIRLSVDKGVIPSHMRQEYAEDSKNKKNEIVHWIMADRQSKTELILSFIDYFDEEDITIDDPADQYVDRMNAAIYKTIRENAIDPKNPKGSLIEMFRKIAAMEGDFIVEGKTRIESLKEALGGSGVREFKKTHPIQYRYLESLDSQQ